MIFNVLILLVYISKLGYFSLIDSSECRSMCVYTYSQTYICSLLINLQLVHYSAEISRLELVYLNSISEKSET